MLVVLPVDLAGTWSNGGQNFIPAILAWRGVSSGKAGLLYRYESYLGGCTGE